MAVDFYNQRVIVANFIGGFAHIQVLSWLALDLVTTTDQIKLVSNMMHIPIKNSLIFKEDHGTVLKLFKSDSSN